MKHAFGMYIISCSNFLETTLFKFILINFKTQAYLIMGNTMTLPGINC